MKRVYIIRHGQTDANKRNACLGQKDVPLNSKGEKQAYDLMCKLREIPVDVIYSSPLKRVIDTIEPIVSLRSSTRLVMSYDLIERDFGKWDDMTFKEIEQEYPDEYASWREDWLRYKIPDGESDKELHQRVTKAVDEIINREKNKIIMFVTHLGASRHIISHLLGLTQEASWHFFLDNAGIAVVDIDENGKGILKGLNI